MASRHICSGRLRNNEQPPEILTLLRRSNWMKSCVCLFFFKLSDTVGLTHHFSSHFFATFITRHYDELRLSL